MSTRVRRWFSEHPPTAFIACLEGCVKLLNYLIALIGLSMSAIAVYFYVELENKKPLKISNNELLSNGIIDLLKVSWFMACFGCAGLFIFLTATSALIGAAARSIACLNVNVVLVLVGLAGQILLAVAFVLDDSWESRLPPDPEYDRVKAFIKQQFQLCQWFGLGALAVQLVTLLLTLILQSAYMHVHDMAEDAEDSTWGRDSTRRSLLDREPTPRTPSRDNLPRPSTSSRTVPLPLGGAPRTDPWSIRMREQYNLDTSRYSYDPESTAAGVPVPYQRVQSPPDRGCTVM